MLSCTVVTGLCGDETSHGCIACVCVSSQRFLQRFIDPTSVEDENASLDLNEPLYMQKLDEVRFSLVGLHCFRI